MLYVRDIMTRNPVTVSIDCNIIEATKLMLEHKFNGLPVVDENNVVLGVICQSDLVIQQKNVALPSLFTMLDGLFHLDFTKEKEAELKKALASTVRDAMTEHPTVISPETSIDKAASLMVDSQYYTLPVVENGKLVGVVAKEDILRTLIEQHAQ